MSEIFLGWKYIFGWRKIFWSEKFVNREKNLVRQKKIVGKLFLSEIFFVRKMLVGIFFLVGKNCGQKKHIVGGGKIGQKKKKLVRKKMLVGIFFGWKQNFGRKICQVGNFVNE